MRHTLRALLFFMIPISTLALSATNASIPEGQRILAAQKAAKEQKKCKDITPFYWEIGDGSKILASGTSGDGSVIRDTRFPIASASKLVFGAYVIQRVGGKIDGQTEKYLKMTSGYTNLEVRSCFFTPTIKDCFQHGSNSTYSKENDDKFFYNGGHFQKWAVENGLGPMTRGEIRAEYQKILGADFDFSFGILQLAGGLNTSAKNFAVFLQKIINGKLLIRNFLGAHSTCTLPEKCPQAIRSPIPLAWHYSYGHWVEDDPLGDGAFSSPGAFGFYPWISADKKLYGIVSRRQKAQRENFEIGAGYASALCGQVIRKAYITGLQP